MVQDPDVWSEHGDDVNKSQTKTDCCASTSYDEDEQKPIDQNVGGEVVAEILKNKLVVSFRDPISWQFLVNHKYSQWKRENGSPDRERLVACWYDLQIVFLGDHSQLFLDDVLWQVAKQDHNKVAKYIDDFLGKVLRIVRLGNKWEVFVNQIHKILILKLNIIRYIIKFLY